MLRSLPRLPRAELPHLVGAVDLHGPDEGVVVLVHLLLDGGDRGAGVGGGEVGQLAEGGTVLETKFACALTIKK